MNSPPPPVSQKPSREGRGCGVLRIPGFGKTEAHLVGQFIFLLLNICFFMKCKWASTLHIQLLTEVVLKIGMLGSF